MVRADDLISIRDRRTGPDKESAKVRKVIQEVSIIPRHHVNMLGGNAVGLGQHLLLGIAKNNLAVGSPRLSGYRSSRENPQQPFNLPERLTSEVVRICNHNGGRVRAMLRLPKKISCANF